MTAAKRLAVSLAASLGLLCSGGFAGTAVSTGTCADASSHSWTASWAASPVFAIGPEFDHQTVRQTLRLSLGGSRLRVRFSNENGASPVVIAGAHIALPGRTPGSIDPASDRVLTFNGAAGVTLPAGAPMVSDPVDYPVAPLSSVTLSIYLTRHTGPSTLHPDGNATAFIAAGDHTAEATIPDATTSTARILLSEVDVLAASPSYSLVTLGDSITDGALSSLDQNHRWPDYLAERLAAAEHLPAAARLPAQSRLTAIGIANAGIGGNRLLHDMPEPEYGPSVLARLDRDVLSVPSLKWVILLIGINDIGHPTASGLPEQDVSAEQIIAGLRQVIDRVRGRGARIIGATLLPFAGTIYTDFYTAEGEQKRQAVNAWIRQGGAYDGVIDFDAVMRDPGHPTHLNAAYDSGDHLHPNDTGYRKMAEAVDLKFITAGQGSVRCRP